MLVQEKAPVQGQAAPAPDQAGASNVRFDPVILYSQIASVDWTAGATTNAIGQNQPAVSPGGRIVFFEPFPGPALCTFKQGGLAPFECTLFQMRIAWRSQSSRSIAEIAAAGYLNEAVAPRGAQIAEIIGRGRLTLRADKIPVIEDCPVDLIGHAGGVIVTGGPQAGTGLMRGTGWTDGFPFPEPIQASAAGPHFEGWIDLLPFDLATLGVASGVGVGAPLEPTRYIDAALAIQKPPALPSVLGIEFFGQRGLNVKSGQVPMPPGLPCYYNAG